MNVIIFGCGGVGLTAKDKLEDDGMNIVAFADNNEKRHGTFVEGCKVISPEEISSYDYDYIAIAVFKHVASIRTQLYSLNIPEEKIIVPVEPEYKIFVNPAEYEYEELITLSEDNYGSQSTKNYEKLHIEVQDKAFLAKLDELKKVLLENNIPREKVCVVKGAVMVAYGLRASKRFEDIDIIMTNDLRELYGKGNVWISEDIEMVATGYMDGRNDDEIIKDVNKHFVFQGLKFMNLEDFYEYKRNILLVKPNKPGLEKDLDLMRKFFREHPDSFTNISEDKLTTPIQPEQRIFVNPAKYTEEELVTISRDDYESEATKKYEAMHIDVTDKVFLDRLNELKNILWENNIPREKICVARGAVMVAYGLRGLKESENIDIIMTDDLRELYGRKFMRISDHITMSTMYYMNGRNEDEIIKDVNKHFVFQGLKFMNLEDVYKFKKEVRLLKSYKSGLKEDLDVLKRFYNSKGILDRVKSKENL